MVPFFHAKYILSIDALVVDAIHQVADEENTQAANGTLVNGEGGVSLAHAGGVKLRARIAEDESYPALVGLNGHAYIVFSIIWIGIINDIGDGFLDGQLDLVGEPGFHVQGCCGRLHKCIEFRDFAHLIN